MWEFRHTDELNHAEHKYVAKVGEGKNARYFYTQEAYNAYKQGDVKSANVGDVVGLMAKKKTEASRALDNAKYDAQMQLKGGVHGLNIEKQKTMYGEGSKEHVVATGKALADLGATQVLKQLNQVGSGKADDAVVKAVNKGRDFMKKLFG